MEIREKVPLAALTYYRIGGEARYLAQPTCAAELAEVSRFLKSSRMPYFILGAGSNVLFDDLGFDGLVLHTAKLNVSLTQEDTTLLAGAGVMNIQLLRHCMKTGLAGFEFLAGVPGNIGGAVFMNAGTKLGEIRDVAMEVEAFDLESGTSRLVERSGLKFEYRRQLFLKPHEIILSARLAGRSSEPRQVQDQIQQLLENRRKTQPVDKPSCGSVFRNPDPGQGLLAWKLIDEAGLRGRRIGNAQISSVHSNFIVNLGQARAEHVRALIDEAKAAVAAKSGVLLEEEVQLIPYRSERRLA